MKKDGFGRDRLTKRDYLFATVAGVLFCFIYLVFSAPGLDPLLWEDTAVAAGLMPPRTVFPGFWRWIASGLISWVGLTQMSRIMGFIGAVAGGLCVSFVYLTIRQLLAYLVRLHHIERWRRWIAPLFAFVGAVAFGSCDAMWRILQPFTPGTIQILGMLFCFHLCLRWYYHGGQWRLFVLMASTGFIAAETPIVFLLPAVYYVGYLLADKATANGIFHPAGPLPDYRMFPRWRMFFCFVGGLVLGIGLNVWYFIDTNGLAVSGWDPLDIVFRYVIGYWWIMRSAATPVGWVLAFTLALLPFLLVLLLFPRVSHDTEPMPFKLGIVVFFGGLVALLECGVISMPRFWYFAAGSSQVHSDMLMSVFAFMAVTALALAGAIFTNASHLRYEFDADDEGESGFGVIDHGNVFLNLLVPAVVIACVVPAVLRIPRPADREIRSIVNDAMRETIRECGDAKFLFTDGHLDAGIELAALEAGSGVKALNMMSGSSNWERYMNTHHFEDGPDKDNATIGVPVLLRVWAGEMTNGMDNAAVQLGFEFWKRARRPLPRLSGLVAREKGIDDKEAERGIAAAKALSERIIRVSESDGIDSVSQATKQALSAVSWRLSRFARLRADDQLANRLDSLNDAVKHMMGILEYERMRTFMQLTPYEGLRLALRRADFIEARRYGAAVLAIDQGDPEANFGTGMAYLMEEKLREAELYLERCLKARPNEPAVLNNLAIVYRKTNRLDKALEYAKKAHDLLPDNEEIKKTLADTERAIEGKARAVKSAVGR
jgi:tetratricopeptide (TPR) repeat protein